MVWSTPDTCAEPVLGSLASALYIINLPVDDAMITDLATAATAGITTLADRHHSGPG
ncbi:hypothetical protein [Streptomyces aureocirculatus]|uniref:hypothetical protein n=1 Tax=Streptomyces aureocirculatus TaxID=67275 RepID=UPI001CEC8A4E|nr:hypothetical protein [Streptomyces aureocirculatus]